MQQVRPLTHQDNCSKQTQNKQIDSGTIKHHLICGVKHGGQLETDVHLMEAEEGEEKCRRRCEEV